MLNTLRVGGLTVPSPVSSRQATVAPAAKPCIISCEVGPTDRQALLDLFARSSADTRRSRFHSALSVFPQRYLDEILTGKQLALVARDTCQEENHGKVFGLASAARSWHRRICRLGRRRPAGARGRHPARAGDPALLVDRGTRAAIGIMEPDNLAIRRLFGRVAPGAVARFEDGMIVVSVPLPDWVDAQEARF